MRQRTERLKMELTLSGMLIALAAWSPALAQTPTQEVADYNAMIQQLKNEIVELEKRLAEAEKENRVAEVEREEDDAFFDRLQEGGLSLAGARTGKDKNKGASFSYVWSRESASDYSADFFLAWDVPNSPDILVDMGSNIRLSVEGHLSEDRSNNEDALSFRVGVVQDIEDIPGVDGLYLTYMVTHQSDIDFETRKLFFESEASPTITSLAIGSDWPGLDRNTGERPPVQFRWRPMAGFSLGHTFEAGRSSEDENLLLRIPASLRAQLKLNFLQDFLGIDTDDAPAPLLFAEPRMVILPIEGDNHLFFNGGLDIPFSENLSVGFQYKNGEAAPLFEDIQVYEAYMGVKF